MLERLSDALSAAQNIRSEIAGYAMNSDRTAPSCRLQKRRRNASARHKPADSTVRYRIVSTRDIYEGGMPESLAIREVIKDSDCNAYFNNTKGFIGHAMGAAAHSNSPGICRHSKDQRRPSCSISKAGPDARVKEGGEPWGGSRKEM
jgi:3-oxoacyl-[acyl-carrier-protein] synthase II